MDIFVSPDSSLIGARRFLNKTSFTNSELLIAVVCIISGLITFTLETWMEASLSTIEP